MSFGVWGGGGGGGVGGGGKHAALCVLWQSFFCIIIFTKYQVFLQRYFFFRKGGAVPNLNWWILLRVIIVGWHAFGCIYLCMCPMYVFYACYSAECEEAKLPWPVVTGNRQHFFFTVLLLRRLPYPHVFQCSQPRPW